MKPYSVLELMPAEHYLNPENFVTFYDGKKETKYDKEQYEAGLKYGNEFDEIHISVRSTWSGSMLDRKTTISACEGIGYHSGTAALLRGFLDSTAKIVVHRKFLDQPVVIKQSSKVAAIAG